MRGERSESRADDAGLCTFCTIPTVPRSMEQLYELRRLKNSVAMGRLISMILARGKVP